MIQGRLYFTVCNTEYPIDVFQNQAAANSTALQNYSKGVQMGCWGLVIYAATAALCSGVCYVYVLYLNRTRL